MADTLHCDVITPEDKVLECEATSVILPAHDGLVGIMHDRAPLLCKLGYGPLRVETSSGTQSYFIESGFAQMLNNKLTILTAKAQPIADIKSDEARKELEDALALPSGNDEEVDGKFVAVERARARVRSVSA